MESNNKFIDLELGLSQQLMLENTKRNIHNWKREELEELFLQLFQLYLQSQSVNRQLFKLVAQLEIGELTNVSTESPTE